MRLALAAALVLLTLPARAAEIRVFAAASLSDALTEIASAYERASGDELVFNFASSGTLARQIELGAPADLFLSADERTMDRLARRGLVATRVSLLSNTLAVVVPARGGRCFASVQELSGAESIAIADPADVPAGVYARTYLIRAGMWDRLQAKIIPTANVRGALAAVEAGNADAAIVYRTDALISRKVRIAFEVPRDGGPSISYPFAVLKNAEDERAAMGLLAYLRSDAAKRVFARYGFVIP